MSTLDEREQLIQQRQAEKYINVIRMTLLCFLTAALFIRGFRGTELLSSLAPLILIFAWGYSLTIHWSVSRGFLPRYLPWLTTIADMVFIVVGFAFEDGLSNHNLLASTSLSWGYPLLFLLILFSTLRERPILTLFNGICCSVLYGTSLVLFFPQEPYAGFWTDQAFRAIFLLLAGFFSGFHARSVRKAFARAATSDRLRRETDARLQVLALHFPGVLFQAEVTDETLELRYVSEGSRELLGIEPQDVLDRPELFFEKADPELQKTLRRQMRASLDGIRSWDHEFSYRVAENRTLWLKMSVTTHQSLRGTLVNGLLADVSEQRRAAEALREANQAKTDFLATMSHELRTPLNAILGNADHLSRLADQEDDKKAFRDLQASGETLLGLIEDILVFSRLEAGRLVADVRPVDWRAQLESLIQTFRPQALAKGLSLQTHFPNEAPVWLWTDVLRLRQILSNLLGNAIKFTPSGSVMMDVAFETDEKGAWFVVQVSDTGIGIPPESQDRIFEKFTQGEHGKSRTYGGLGLGLSIGRSLAELLGGSLSLKSEPGRGSSFFLRIPIRAGGTGDLSLPSLVLDETRQAARVLLVEDNLTNQDVATRMLKKLGAQVDLAPGGREAISLVSEQFYDLIFMDWQMPGMDGREATAKIRALPGGQDLVIVALSGHALPGDRELLLASGFDDYLSKPVRMDDFRSMLVKWVKTHPGRG